MHGELKQEDVERKHHASHTSCKFTFTRWLLIIVLHGACFFHHKDATCFGRLLMQQCMGGYFELFELW